MARLLAAAALVACALRPAAAGWVESYLVACALRPAAAGWVESYDKKSNKKFYYDEETRKTQWEKPDGESDEQESPPRRRYSPDCSAHIRPAATPGTAHSSRIWGQPRTCTFSEMLSFAAACSALLGPVSTPPTPAVAGSAAPIGRRALLGGAAALALARPAVADTQVKKFFTTDGGVKYFDIKEGGGY